MKTAKQLYENRFNRLNIEDNEHLISEIMIEFAKMHVLKIKHLQQNKYYSGETGYIKSEEWEDIIKDII